MSDMKKLLEAIDSMAKAEKKPTGPKFPGYWKGTDPASAAKDKMVGGAQESIIKELDKTAKDTATERKLKEEFANFQDVSEGVVDTLKGAWDKISQFDDPSPKYDGNTPRRKELRKKLEKQQKQKQQQGVAEGYYDDLGPEYGGAYVNGRSDDARETARLTRQAKAAAKKAGKTFSTSAEYRKWHSKQKEKQGVAEGSDGVDTISVDVPLLIRLLEYAREDAQTDLDLHDVAERLIKLSQEDRVLTMQDYDSICPSEQMHEENVVTPNATTTNSNNTQDQNNLQAATAAMDKKNVATTQNNLNKLKTVAPGLNPGLANQALQGIETNPAKTVSGQQLKQTQNLADLVGDALADPQKGSQLATLIQQVQTAKRTQQ